MDASAAGLAYVEELLNANARRRPSRDATAVRRDAQDQAAISAARDAQRARHPLLLSPHLIVDAHLAPPQILPAEQVIHIVKNHLRHDVLAFKPAKEVDQPRLANLA